MRTRGITLQFSLRTLLLVMVLVSVALSWLACKLENARRQRVTIEKLQGLQLFASYWRPAEDGVPTNCLAKGRWPESLVRLSGLEFFYNVRGVYSLGVIAPRPIQLAFADRDLVLLNSMTSLTELYVDDTEVTDAGLPHLKSLLHLEELGLARTGVTDEGLVHLRALRYLKSLDLEDTDVGDAGLVHLRALQRLERLDLSGTRVTHRGLLSLQHLPQLKALDLSNTKLADGAVPYIKELGTLQFLQLDGTQVTAEGRRELLAALPNLLRLE